MSRHLVFFTTYLSFVFAAMAGTSSARAPNIIYLMADELGYYELSCLGNPHIQTPHIDRLAAEGMRFTQALAGSSVCAPTRGVLMTGKHSGHTSVRSNGGGTPLRVEEETIASVLKQGGYATGGYGKWGCGGRGSTGVPEKHGFDEFLGYYDQVHAHTYYPPYLVRNSEEVALAGNFGGSRGETYSHYRIYEAAVKFIRRNHDQPFFCYLPFTPPHGIFDIPDDDPAWALYRDKDWPEQAKRYAAMVSMVDRQVGELIDLLKELGLDQDTIFFFCGDNGGNDYFKTPDHPRGFHGANVDPKTGVEFRGKKGNLYEGGLRIPMIVRWPGRIAPGQVSDLLWYFPDVLPTLAELAGVPPPADIDGMSIVPTLLGPATTGRVQDQHEYLYWEIGGQTAVRWGLWKAYRPRDNRPWELYHLETDVSEQHDVAQKQPAILARMQQYAEAAHEPVREGTFFDRAIHERDRRAKMGQQDQPAATPDRSRMHTLPRVGLVPTAEIKLIRASSENTDNHKFAAQAIDGDPSTLWHSRFSGNLAQPPHSLVFDLGRERTVKGFRYLARQDQGWNGTVKECELRVSTDPDHFAEPAVEAVLRKVRTPQEVNGPPVKGRYVMWRIQSEISGGPWASAAEFGVIAE